MIIKRAVSNFLEGKKRPQTGMAHADHSTGSNQAIFAKSGSQTNIRPMSPFRSGLLRAPVSQCRLRVENGRVQVKKSLGEIPHGTTN
jgi:hypothetical protein